MESRSSCAKIRGTIDILTLQTLARRNDTAEPAAGYGLVIADECHHVPAAAFEHAVKQIPARRWLGLTATPYRRDRLDDLIALQVGPVRHTITRDKDQGQNASSGTMRPLPREADTGAPARKLDLVLKVHPTGFCYTGDAGPSAPGGISAVYRDLVADDARTKQVADDVAAALRRERNLSGAHQVDRAPRPASRGGKRAGTRPSCAARRDGRQSPRRRARTAPDRAG